MGMVMPFCRSSNSNKCEILFKEGKLSGHLLKTTKIRKCSKYGRILMFMLTLGYLFAVMSSWRLA